MSDTFDLALINIRFPRRTHTREINCPPQGEVGTNRARWYVVLVGKKVGIFNEWYVFRAIYTPHPFLPSNIGTKWTPTQAAYRARARTAQMMN